LKNEIVEKILIKKTCKNKNNKKIKIKFERKKNLRAMKFEKNKLNGLKK
jgi:hypothetical protein